MTTESLFVLLGALRSQDFIFKANPTASSELQNLHDCKWIKSPATASGIRDLILSTPSYFTESNLQARHQLKKCDRRRCTGSQGGAVSRWIVCIPRRHSQALVV
ncbi:unnamed protein product [Musa acuminata subsp. burmannicoides]